MRNIPVGLLLSWLLASPLAHAGGLQVSKPLIVFAYTDQPSVSVSMRKEADYVSMPLSITSDHADPSKRFIAIAQAKAAIQKAAESKEGLRVYAGPVALSGKPRGISFYLSSGGYGNSSTAQLHVLVPLADTKKDIFRCATEIVEFVQSVRQPSKADVKYGKIQLAMDNPDQYREPLLKLVAEEVSNTRDALGNWGRVVVEGLESPVVVRQADDRHVDLFIRYRLSITLED